MASINDLKNGIGKIYVRISQFGVPLGLGVDIPFSTYDNTPNGFLAAFADGLTAGSVFPLGFDSVYDTQTGKTFYLYPDASAPDTITAGNIAIGVAAGDIVDITSRMVMQGMQSHISTQFTSINAFNGTIDPVLNRNNVITQAFIDINGVNTEVKAITNTGWSEGDIIIIRGNDVSNPITVKSFVSGSNNIYLANGADFVSGDKTRSLVLQYSITDNKWYETARTPNLEISVATMRAAGIPQPVSGTNLTPILAAGLSVTYTAGTDKGTQVFDSAAALTMIGNVTIAVTGGTPLDGDEFWIDYRATLDTTTNSTTVFIGTIQLTETQALLGNVVVRAKYKLSNTTWYYELFTKSNGRDLVDSVQLATKQDDLGFPTFNSATLQRDTTGNPYWASTNKPITNIINVNPLGDDAAALANLVANYTLVPPQFGNNQGFAFKTIAAAAAAADTIITSFGGQFNESNRLLIRCSPGYWNEPIVLKKFIDYDLEGSTVEVTGSTGSTVTTSGLNPDGRIYGHPTIRRSSGTVLVGTNVGAVIITESTSKCILYLGNVFNSVDGFGAVGVGAIINSGSSVIYANNVYNDGSALITAVIQATNTSATYCNDVLNASINPNSAGTSTSFGVATTGGTPSVICRDIINNTTLSGLAGCISFGSGAGVGTYVKARNVIANTGNSEGLNIGSTAGAANLECVDIINTSTHINSRLFSFDFLDPVHTENNQSSVQMRDGIFNGVGCIGIFIGIDGTSSEARITARRITCNGGIVVQKSSAKLRLEADEIISVNSYGVDIGQFAGTKRLLLKANRILTNGLCVTAYGDSIVRVECEDMTSTTSSPFIISGNADVTINNSRLVALGVGIDCIDLSSTIDLKLQNVVMIAEATAFSINTGGTEIVKSYGLNVANRVSNTSGNVQVQNDGVAVVAGEFTALAVV